MTTERALAARLRARADRLGQMRVHLQNSGPDVAPEFYTVEPLGRLVIVTNSAGEWRLYRAAYWNTLTPLEQRIEATNQVSAPRVISWGDNRRHMTTVHDASGRPCPEDIPPWVTAF